MKQKIYMTLMAVIALFTVACSSDEIENNTTPPQPITEKLIVTGVINNQDATRIALTDEGDKITPSWEIGDKIFGFWGEERNALAYEVTDVAADGKATFTLINGTEPTNGTTVYMVYAPVCNEDNFRPESIGFNLSVQNGDIENVKELIVMCATATVTDNQLSLAFENQTTILGVKTFTGLPKNTSFEQITLSTAGPSADVKIVEGKLKLVTEPNYGTIEIEEYFQTDENGCINKMVYFTVPPTNTPLPHTFEIKSTDGTIYTGTLSAKAIPAGKYIHLNSKKMWKSSLIQHWTLDTHTRNAVSTYHAKKIGSPSVAYDRFGVSFGAFDFHGPDGMEVDGQAFNVHDGPFTINVWVCSNSKSPKLQHIIQTDNSVYQSGCLLRFNEGRIEIWEGRTQQYNYITTKTYNDGNWHMLTYTRFLKTNYTKKGKLYIDGSHVGGYEISGKVNDVTHNFWIGTHSGTGDSGFIGKIDDIRLYDRALSDDEIKQLYIPAFKN